MRLLQTRGSCGRAGLLRRPSRWSSLRPGRTGLPLGRGGAVLSGGSAGSGQVAHQGAPRNLPGKQGREGGRSCCPLAHGQAMCLPRSILSPCCLALNALSAALLLGPKCGRGQLWLQDTLETLLSALQVTRMYLGFAALLAPMRWITFHHFWHPAVDAGCSRSIPRPGRGAGGEH